MTQEVNRIESVTRSLRITADKAEQYDKIRELFNNAGEFTDWVIDAYRLHESKQTSDLFRQDTKAIMDMFQSIFGVIGGVVSRAEGMVQSKDAEIVEELRAKDDLAEDLRTELKALQDIISEKDAEIKVQNDKVKEVEGLLKENQETLNKTEKEFTTTSKLNEMLMLEKARYEAIEENNKALTEEVKQLKEKLLEAEKQATAGVQKITELIKENETMEQNYINKISAIKEKHKQSLDHAEAIKGIEVSKARFEEKEQAQAQIQAHMNKENELRDKIDNLQETINVYSVSEINKDKEIARLKEELAKAISNKEKPTGDKKHKVSKAKVEEAAEAI